jgi:hypothetical protein
MAGTANAAKAAMAGGKKRKVNKSLKDWVTFVKKVQREENLSYPEAIKRAKQRKDKGEKWKMKGGEGEEAVTPDNNSADESPIAPADDIDGPLIPDSDVQAAGKRTRRRRSRSRSRSRSRGRSRSRRRS